MTSNIEEHIEILSGYPFNSELFNNEQQGRPLIRIRDLEKTASDTYFNGDFQDIYLMNKNDILVGMDGDFLCVKWKGEPSLLNQRICKIAAKETLHQDYLYHNLQDKLDYIHYRTAGTTVKHLSVKDIKKIDIFFPPLKEQEKIADILSTADAKIDAIASQIEKAETLKKGLLQKLLSEGIGHSEFKDSELGKIPLSWEVEKLENLVNIISGQSPSNFDLTGSEYKFFKVNQLNFCEKYLTNSEYAFDEEIDTLLDKGTIIFPKRGASIFTNKVRILTHKSFIDTNLMGLITKDALNNMFLYYWLVEFELSNIADTSSIPQINNKHINPLKIPLPPLKEQKKIADILSTADEKLEVLRAKKERCETLKKGLLQKLLSGEVRVNF